MPEPTTDPAADPATGDPTDPTTDPSSTTTPPATDDAAELEKWKGLARKHEDRAKANAAAARELEQLKASTMSETEKAVAEAKATGRAEAMREAGSRLVDAEVKAAAAGRTVNVDALLEGLDRTRFLDDEGEPDAEAIVAWVDKVAPAAEQPENPPAGFPDLGQGVRTAGTPDLNGDPLLRDLKAKLGIA